MKYSIYFICKKIVFIIALATAILSSIMFSYFIYMGLSTCLNEPQLLNCEIQNKTKGTKLDINFQVLVIETEQIKKFDVYYPNAVEYDKAWLYYKIGYDYSCYLEDNVISWDYTYPQYFPKALISSIFLLGSVIILLILMIIKE